MSVQATKAALRKDIHKRILQLTCEQKRQQSEKVLVKLFNLPVFKNSQRISVFLSTEDEINTAPIVKIIFEKGKKCFVPRYNGQKMEMVRLQSLKDWEDLPLTKWNIKQPSLNEEREDALQTGGLDLIIVPGVAFTITGKRCGHGKGYYDTFLANLFKTQRQRPTTIALSFKEQILDDIPTHEHDVKIDHVLYSD